ncbi:MAG: ABC transporter ATP-binding protein, partial [Spirochaetales bacterium]|nr:ABC transporter ATP-binding protein [Spirochaetales bacterium]
MPYLECRNLKYDYPTFHLDMDFSVEKGEFICVIGPSGSGKSTLLSLIAGIKDPDGGSIILNGRDITSLEIRKRRIGMVFQDFSLFPSMDVERNIQYGMKDMSESEKHAEVGRLLDMVDLAGYEKRQVHELSGGEAQRIALVRAVAAKPRMLLLDEPLSALDAPLRKKLRTPIRQIHEQTGIT